MLLFTDGKIYLKYAARRPIIALELGVTFRGPAASKGIRYATARSLGGVEPLKMRWTNYSLFAAAMAVLSVAAIAGQGKPVAKGVKGGEHSLVGINLYDSG